MQVAFGHGSASSLPLFRVAGLAVRLQDEIVDSEDDTKEKAWAATWVPRMFGRLGMAEFAPHERLPGLQLQGVSQEGFPPRRQLAAVLVTRRVRIEANSADIDE